MMKAVKAGTRKFCILTKTQNEVKWLKTTWNNLKWPTTSKKPHTMRKNLLETTYNEQETKWNNLEQPRVRKNNMKWPTTSKEQPEMTCKEQILTSWNPSTWKIINWRAPMSQRSNRSIWCLQAVFCIICAYGKWWQTGKSKKMSELS